LEAYDKANFREVRTMKGFTGNIEEQTEENDFFRKVVFTAPHSQLVLMSLKPKEEIGEEVHNVDQFFRFEEGEGKVVIDGQESVVKDGWVVVVPAGTKHNVINTSETESLKLYTIYSPAQHLEGTIHKTKEEAMVAEESEH